MRRKSKTQHLLEMLDDLTMFAETVGGLRQQLISQGFSEDCAEAIVLMTLQSNFKANR